MTCLSFSPDGQLLAAGGAAGTVRVWQLQQAAGTAPSASPVLVAAHSSVVAAATGGAAVGTVRWLPTPGGWVLLTGNRNNASLQLWHTAGDAAAAPLEWAPLQMLQFEGKDGQSEFYNQLDVVPTQQVGAIFRAVRRTSSCACLESWLGTCVGGCSLRSTNPSRILFNFLQLVVLADTARNAVYTLHYSGALSGVCLEGSRPCMCKAASCWHDLRPASVAHVANPPGSPGTWRRDW